MRPSWGAQIAGAFCLPQRLFHHQQLGCSMTLLRSRFGLLIIIGVLVVAGLIVVRPGNGVSVEPENDPVPRTVNGFTSQEYIAKETARRTYYYRGQDSVDVLVEGPGQWVVQASYLKGIAGEWLCLGSNWNDRVFALRMLAGSPHVQRPAPAGFPLSCDRPASASPTVAGHPPDAHLPAAVYPDPEIDVYTLPGMAPTGMNCPPEARIKGNISARGEWIYHIPSGALYRQTKPETCFATAAEAEQAGFRRSRR